MLKFTRSSGREFHHLMTCIWKPGVHVASQLFILVRSMHIIYVGYICIHTYIHIYIILYIYIYTRICIFIYMYDFLVNCMVSLLWKMNNVAITLNY